MLKYLTLGVFRDIFVLVYIYTLRRLVYQYEECVKYLLKANKQTFERIIVKAVTGNMLDGSIPGR
jgi:hypothetical protein